jgi:uncharacterized membrane protein
VKTLFTIFLIVHIAGGGTALIAGFIAMLNVKGGTVHRTAGKFFFWGMTAACIAAVYLSIAHPNPFLLMIAFFSYQLVSIGYRSLYIKKLFTGTVKPKATDWLIGIVPALFNVSIIIWGINKIMHGNNFGFTGIIFGSIGLRYSYNWFRQFFIPPKEKQHWLFTHFQGFGAAYIASVTAFLVVNINFLLPLLVWLSPTVIGATLITLTTIKYKKKFSKNEKVKYITD